MDKLFNDSETFTKERPTKLSQEQERLFYENIAKEIIKNKWSEDDIEFIIEDLDTISIHDTNGYAIAKSLDSSSSSAGYDIDSEFVQFLDNFNYERGILINKNVKDWVKAHNIKPKFKTGDELLIKRTIYQYLKANSTVYITGTKEDCGDYYINEDKNGNGGYVLSYERIESDCELVKK